MRIRQKDARLENTAVAIGAFDGVHMGHRKVVLTMLEAAREHGLTPVVYTFSSLPAELFSGAVNRRIMTVGQKLAAIAALGVEDVILAEFNAEYASAPPEEFEETLARHHGAKVVVVGDNFTYGARAAGTAETLKGRGAFQTVVVPPVLSGGRIVSSTRIRACLSDGDVEEANRLLCSRYAIDGRVEHGRKNGRAMGIPTINQGHEGKMLPAFGVYATTAIVGGKAFKSVTNVGDNPTFDGERVTVETHVMDFEGDIYDESPRVEFIARLRPQRRFAGPDELAARIKEDIRRRTDMPL